MDYILNREETEEKDCEDQGEKVEQILQNLRKAYKDIHKKSAKHGYTENPTG